MKMKISIVSAILTIGLTAGFVSCSPDYETDFSKSLLEVPHKSQAMITFQREGGEKTIDVETNVPLDQWQAEANAEWCEVTKANGKVTVKAGSYDGYQQRKALVTVKYGHQEYKIQVVQMGYQAAMDMVEDGGVFNRKNGYTAYVSGNTTEFVIPLSTNLNIDYVIVPDTTSWVHFDSTTELPTDEQGRKLITLQLDPNKTNQDRYCTMTLQSSQNWDATVQFLLIQSRIGYTVVPCYGTMNYEIVDLGGKLRIPYAHDEKADGAYTAEVDANAQEWLHIGATSLSASNDELYATVDMNLTDNPRSGTITLKSSSGTKEYVITVNQQKFNPVPPFNVENATATAGNGSITLNWDRPEVVNYSKIVITMFNAQLNKTITKEITDVNTTSVTFDKTFKFAGEYTFTIKSYGPTDMETNDPVVVNATSNEWSENVQITLTESMITANATQTNDGGGIPALIDGKTSTFYHSLWGSNSPDGKPHRIQIALSNPSASEFYFDYFGRGNGDGGGDIKRARIYGSNSGAESDAAWTDLGEISYTLPSARGQQGVALNTIKTTEGYRYLRFVPTAIRKKDPLGLTGTKDDWFNLSELRLFEVHDENWAQQNLQQILGN